MTTHLAHVATRMYETSRLGTYLSTASLLALLAAYEGDYFTANDPTRMFQDHIGITPAVVDQPVGFVAGQRAAMAAVGAELLSNTTFATTAGWTAGAAANTISAPGGGRLRVAANTATATVGGRTTISTVIGKWYRVAVDMFDGLNSSNLRVFVGTSAGGSQNLTTSGLTPAGSYPNLYFRATAATTHIQLTSTVTGSGDYAEFANPSVKEVGILNAAFNATASQRPILRYDALVGRYYLESDGIDDILAGPGVFTISGTSYLAAAVYRAAQTGTVLFGLSNATLGHMLTNATTGQRTGVRSRDATQVVDVTDPNNLSPTGTYLAIDSQLDGVNLDKRNNGILAGTAVRSAPLSVASQPIRLCGIGGRLYEGIAINGRLLTTADRNNVVYTLGRNMGLNL